MTLILNFHILIIPIKFFFFFLRLSIPFLLNHWIKIYAYIVKEKKQECEIQVISHS